MHLVTFHHWLIVTLTIILCVQFEGLSSNTFWNCSSHNALGDVNRKCAVAMESVRQWRDCHCEDVNLRAASQSCWLGCRLLFLLVVIFCLNPLVRQQIFLYIQHQTDAQA